MGSGLILLVIVAAWLAVLVPMALRSHDSSTSLSSVDRFSDAMRVLSRRDPGSRARARLEADQDDPLSAAAYAEGQDDDEEWDDGEGSRWRERLGAGRDHARRLADRVRGRWSGRRRRTPVARRRRLLVTLVLLTAGCLAGGLLGPQWLLAVAGVLLVGVALFVVRLRRLAVRRAASLRRHAAPAPAPAAHRGRPAQPARPARPAAAAAAGSGSVRVQPAVPAPVERSADPVHADPVPMHEDPVPAAVALPASPTYAAPAAALGEAWSPVPVPVPTYVTAPVAPPVRAARIVDLTRPGAWTSPEAPRPIEELPGTAPVPEHVPERRRVVNEW